MNSTLSERSLEQTGEIRMKRRRHCLIPVAVTMIAFVFGVFAPSASAYDGEMRWRHHARPKLVELSDARLKFEINSTDEDGGVQVFLDADPWKWMSIFGPNRKMIFRSANREGLSYFWRVVSQNSVSYLLRSFSSVSRKVTIDLEGEGLRGSDSLARQH